MSGPMPCLTLSGCGERGWGLKVKDLCDTLGSSIPALGSGSLGVDLGDSPEPFQKELRGL